MFLENKLNVLLIIVMFIIINIPTFSQTDNDNKCFTQWNWCNDGTSDENAYWWQAGWCAAALESGEIVGTIEGCTSSPDDDIQITEETNDEDKKQKKRKVCDFVEGNEGPDIWEDADGNMFLDADCTDPWPF